MAATKCSRRSSRSFFPAPLARLACFVLGSATSADGPGSLLCKALANSGSTGCLFSCNHLSQFSGVTRHSSCLASLLTIVNECPTQLTARLFFVRSLLLINQLTRSSPLGAFLLFFVF